jgi:molybdate transport system substrate-binding protein
MTHGVAAVAELTILTNQGATPGVRELAAAFARASGNKINITQVEGDALERRIETGPADLVTANPDTIEMLVKNRKIVAGTVTPFALAGLGLSVRAGAPKPDISTVDAYKATLLAAKSIGYSRGCSGTHIAEGIAQLGLTEQLKPRRPSPPAVRSPTTWRVVTSRSASSKPTSWPAFREPTMSARCLAY